MRGAFFRPGLWLAGALLALALAGGCDLNPQPLPPGDRGAPGTFGGSGSTGGSASGSSSGTSSGSDGGTNSGSNSSSSSGGHTGPPAETGDQDAAMMDGGAASIDGAVDAPTPGDGVFDDSGSDDGPPEAAPDAGSEGDAGCVRPWDCHVSHHGACAVCAWPLNVSVCIEGRCACACRERDAAGEP